MEYDDDILSLVYFVGWHLSPSRLVVHVSLAQKVTVCEFFFLPPPPSSLESLLGGQQFCTLHRPVIRFAQLHRQHQLNSQAHG